MEFAITYASTGQTFTCAQDQTILSAMEQRSPGLIPVGCRGGGCGFCRIQLLSGEIRTKKMSIKHVSQEEQGTGVTLACRTFPQSDVVFVTDTRVDITND